MNCSEARAVSLGTQIAEMDMIPKFKQTQGWNTYLSFESRREDARDHIRQWTSRLNTPPSLPLTISSRLTFEFPPLNFLASPSPTSISSPRKAFPPASGRPFRTSPVSAKPNEVLLPSRSFIPDFNLNEHHTDPHCHSKMSGSLGHQNRRGTGGDSRPNKKLQSTPYIYAPGGLQSDPRSSFIWIGSTWRKPTGSSPSSWRNQPNSICLGRIRSPSSWPKPRTIHGKGHQGRSHQGQGMGQRRPAPV